MFALLCLVWMSIASPVAFGGAYLMNDVGGTVTIPDDWEMTRWSDWDFKAKGANGTMMYKLWLTPYQSPINPEAAAAFGEAYIDDLAGEGGGDARVVASTIRTIGGRDTAVTEIAFKTKGGKGSAGAFLGAAFAGNGQVIHHRIIVSQRNVRAARRALDSLLESFELTTPLAELGGPEVESSAGFRAVLESDWRPPVDAERSGVVGIASKMWTSEFGADECWMAIRPPFIGEPDVAFACRQFWDGSPVDKHSFDAIESEWREMFFGKAGAELPPGELVTVGDRVGALFRPRDGANPIRLLVAHFDGGLMALWLRGAALDATGADALMMKAAASVVFTGPNGGAPQIRPDRIASYYLAHRPAHPLVWGPVLLVLGGIVLVVRRNRSRDPYADLDDEL
ncbi:MAG: hypothetical protein VX944_10410 [Myxococcota bacterium]|nr:hypothetical protein [Myxococcota bacterium]MEC9390474.1 hypothetical protein [Myxococcota bacterium]